MACVHLVLQAVESAAKPTLSFGGLRRGDYVEGCHRAGALTPRTTALTSRRKTGASHRGNFLEQLAVMSKLKRAFWYLLLTVLLVGSVASSGLIPDSIFESGPRWFVLSAIVCGAFTGLASICEGLAWLLKSGDDGGKQ